MPSLGTELPKYKGVACTQRPVGPEPRGSVWPLGFSCGSARLALGLCVFPQSNLRSCPKVMPPSALLCPPVLAGAVTNGRRTLPHSEEALKQINTPREKS